MAIFGQKAWVWKNVNFTTKKNLKIWLFLDKNHGFGKISILRLLQLFVFVA